MINSNFFTSVSIMYYHLGQGDLLGATYNNMSIDQSPCSKQENSQKMFQRQTYHQLVVGTYL